eukprot:2894732-Lingulodinium_polyedra.AAC.1
MRRAGERIICNMVPMWHDRHERHAWHERHERHAWHVFLLFGSANARALRGPGRGRACCCPKLALATLH